MTIRPDTPTVAELLAVIREQHDALIACRPVIIGRTIYAPTLKARTDAVLVLEQLDGAIAEGQEWL